MLEEGADTASMSVSTRETASKVLSRCTEESTVTTDVQHTVMEVVRYNFFGHGTAKKKNAIRHFDSHSRRMESARPEQTPPQPNCCFPSRMASGYEFAQTVFLPLGGQQTT